MLALEAAADSLYNERQLDSRIVVTCSILEISDPSQAPWRFHWLYWTSVYVLRSRSPAVGFVGVYVCGAIRHCS